MGIDRARVAAVQAHAEVLAGRSVDDALEEVCVDLSPPQRARSRAVAFDACRWHWRWQAVLAQLLRKKLKPHDQAIASVVICALVEIEQLQTPAHAAVDSYVNLTKALGLGRARGLVNAVLRRYLREREALLAAADKQPAASTAHPPWLLGALRADWPQRRAELLAANNARAPMTLRVNRLQGERAAYLERLATAGIEAAPGPGDWDVCLAQPCPVEQLPDFATGAASVQDSAAQFAAPLLDPQPGQRVLDACAAPGGKTAHLLEWAGGELALTALDVSAGRLRRVDENLERLGLRGQTQRADAAEVESWWDGQPFDRILLDAPCSGSGVIRRHPDIKLLRRADDIVALAATQARLLDALWPLLGEGGQLLYATCSVLRDENARQVEAFVARTADARVLAVDLPLGEAGPHGRQLFPGEGGADGFFYALLARR